jgi:hypothetical protein
MARVTLQTIADHVGVLLGERHWVKRRFQAEIAAADAEAGFTYAP